MRAVPIDQVPEGWERRVLAAPNGDLLDDTIRPLEVVVALQDSARVFVSQWQLDPGDLERLQAGEPIRLSVWGVQPPVAVSVGWLNADGDWADA